MKMQHLVQRQYEDYLAYLRTLVAMRSDFKEPENVMKLMLHCKTVFEDNLPAYNVYFDVQNNLIAIPESVNETEDIVYLSAHADTVGATEAEWDPPFHPWQLYEDEETLVARGVNDCKAGVAYQLFLSKLLKAGALQSKNVIFTITFKEEGAGKKTSSEIGVQMGKDLPLSTQSTYLIVLENTVSIADTPTLSVYLGERSSYAISVEGEMRSLQTVMNTLKNWNPVSIAPTIPVSTTDVNIVTQPGGHVCSVPREENKLTAVISEAEPNCVIHAGTRTNLAVVPSEIQISQSQEPAVHHLVLSNRSFDSLPEIQEQLSGLAYVEEKDLRLSTGFTKEEEFFSNRIAHSFQECEKCCAANIAYTSNVGASDATIILRSMDPSTSDTFLPIVMGPGSRSQRHTNPPRLTHGKNETFDKASGLSAISYITHVLGSMKFLS